LLRRAITRAASFFMSGSRSLPWASSGVAMKIEEYAPDTMPTNSARARSFSGPSPRIAAPANSSAATGSTPMTVVFTERTSTWLTARLAASE
jgi:hypothetical protein